MDRNGQSRHAGQIGRVGVNITHQSYFARRDPGRDFYLPRGAVRSGVDKLRINPCLPPGWGTFQIHYRYRETFYHIRVHISGGGTQVRRLSLDGNELLEDFVSLIDDRRDHTVDVEM